MQRRTKCLVGASLFALLFALLLLVGLLGCVSRTGTFYCESRLSMQGPSIIMKGVSMWGADPKRDVLSTMVGSALTIKGLLFSWWWDTLCIPYDIYLRSNGVDFYVYDQDGQPVPDAQIIAYGTDSFYGIKDKTDDRGHFYYPRCVKGFTSVNVTKDGYWGRGQGGTFWLSHNRGRGLPQMLKSEFRGRSVCIPTTNDMHTVNFFMKKIPARIPVAQGSELVISNIVAGVEYEIDLSNAELCPPFGPGKRADVHFKVLDNETAEERRVSRSVSVRSNCSKVLPLECDECGNWPYLYYVPPKSAFDTVDGTDVLKIPVVVSMPDSADKRKRYAFIESSWVEQHRKTGDLQCLHFRYWLVEPSEDNVLVCNRSSANRKKLITPTNKELHVKESLQ